MGINTGRLEIDVKHDLLIFLPSRGQKQNATKPLSVKLLATFPDRF